MTVYAETSSAGTYEVTTPAELERVVQRMSKKNPYVVVTRDDRAGFAQTHLGDGREPVLVEYRGGPRSQLHRAHLPRDHAAVVLTGWAFDRSGWRSGIGWESESLQRYVDTKSHCNFRPTKRGISCRLAGSAPAGLEAFWEVVAVAGDQRAAHAEWLTLTAVLSNSSSVDTRIAWGMLLGPWVVQGSGKTPLNAEQLTRINASSPMSWEGGPSD